MLWRHLYRWADNSNCRLSDKHKELHVVVHCFKHSKRSETKFTAGIICQHLQHQLCNQISRQFVLHCLCLSVCLFVCLSVCLSVCLLLEKGAYPENECVLCCHIKVSVLCCPIKISVFFTPCAFQPVLNKIQNTSTRIRRGAVNK